MVNEKTALQKRIESAETILIAEIGLPASGNGEAVRQAAKRLAPKVHAIGVSDNRSEVRMSALAGAAIVAAAGVEPVLHMVTRDRNRIALISDCLGAEALGVRNVLCTSGTHQTLGRFSAAKNVFDVDPIQLLQTVKGLNENGAAVVGTARFDGAGPFCLGAVASPFADPAEMQLRRLAKKIEAGTQFFITQPVYDVARFALWWKTVTVKGLDKKAAILAGVRVLTSVEEAKACAAERPDPVIPQGMLDRIASAPDKVSQRTAGIALAVETIGRLAELSGLRGFEIRCDSDENATLEVIEKAGL